MRERGRSNWAVGVNPRRLKVSGRRRLATGESRRGGALRDSPTERRLARKALLRDADAHPHPTVVVAQPGSGRSGAGDELGGGRSSVELGLVAAVA